MVTWVEAADLVPAAWQGLIAAAADATPFHTLGWAAAMATLPGTIVRAALLCEGEQYRAGVLVAERRAGPVVKRSAGVYGTRTGLRSLGLASRVIIEQVETEYEIVSKVLGAVAA